MAQVRPVVQRLCDPERYRALCRHLEGRLISQSISRQQLPVSTHSPQRAVRPMNGSVLSATSQNGLQSMDVSQAEQQAAASMPNEAPQLDSEQCEPSVAGQGADEACDATRPIDQHRPSSGIAKPCPAAQQIRYAKYLQKKKVPWLTCWWESTCAFMAVFLLPLISVVPFSTTAERPDSHFGQP